MPRAPQVVPGLQGTLQCANMGKKGPEVVPLFH